MVGYAILMDLKETFRRAILEDKFHVAITIENEGNLESFVFSQRISTKDAVSTIKTDNEC